MVQQHSITAMVYPVIWSPSLQLHVAHFHQVFDSENQIDLGGFPKCPCDGAQLRISKDLDAEAGSHNKAPLSDSLQYSISLHKKHIAFTPLDNVCYLYNAPAGATPCGAWPDVPAWLPPGLQDQQELGHHPPGHQGAAGHLQDGPAAGGHQLPLHPPHPLHLQPQ